MGAVHTSPTSPLQPYPRERGRYWTAGPNEEEEKEEKRRNAGTRQEEKRTRSISPTPFPPSLSPAVVPPLLYGGSWPSRSFSAARVVSSCLPPRQGNMWRSLEGEEEEEENRKRIERERERSIRMATEEKRSTSSMRNTSQRRTLLTEMKKEEKKEEVDEEILQNITQRVVDKKEEAQEGSNDLLFKGQAQEAPSSTRFPPPSSFSRATSFSPVVERSTSHSRNGAERKAEHCPPSFDGKEHHLAVVPSPWRSSRPPSRSGESLGDAGGRHASLCWRAVPRPSWSLQDVLEEEAHILCCTAQEEKEGEAAHHISQEGRAIPKKEEEEKGENAKDVVRFQRKAKNISNESHENNASTHLLQVELSSLASSLPLSSSPNDGKHTLVRNSSPRVASPLPPLTIVDVEAEEEEAERCVMWMKTTTTSPNGKHDAKPDARREQQQVEKRKKSAITKEVDLTMMTGRAARSPRGERRRKQKEKEEEGTIPTSEEVREGSKDKECSIGFPTSGSPCGVAPRRSSPSPRAPCDALRQEKEEGAEEVSRKRLRCDVEEEEEEVPRSLLPSPPNVAEGSTQPPRVFHTLRRVEEEEEEAPAKDALLISHSDPSACGLTTTTDTTTITTINSSSDATPSPPLPPSSSKTAIRLRRALLEELHSLQGPPSPPSCSPSVSCVSTSITTTTASSSLFMARRPDITREGKTRKTEPLEEGAHERMGMEIEKARPPPSGGGRVSDRLDPPSISPLRPSSSSPSPSPVHGGSEGGRRRGRGTTPTTTTRKGIIPTGQHERISPSPSPSKQTSIFDYFKAK